MVKKEGSRGGVWATVWGGPKKGQKRGQKGGVGGVPQKGPKTSKNVKKHVFFEKPQKTSKMGVRKFIISSLTPSEKDL